MQEEPFQNSHGIFLLYRLHYLLPVMIIVLNCNKGGCLIKEISKYRYINSKNVNAISILS